MAYATPNLLPVSASTFEGGTTTWTADSNSRVLVAPGAQRSGTLGMAIQVQVAAERHELESIKFPVTGGTTYAMRAPCGMTSATPEVDIEATLEWYNGDTLLGSNISPPFRQPQAQGYSDPSSFPRNVGRAPNEATHVRFRLSFQGIPVGGGMAVDDVELHEAPLAPGNLLPFSAQGFEVDTSDWNQSNLALTSRRADTMGTGDTGYYIAYGPTLAEGEGVLSTADTYPITPGAEYAAYARVWADDNAATVVSELEWYDDSGAPVPGGAATTYQLGASRVTWAVVVGTAPEGAVSARLLFRFQDTPAGSHVGVDEVSLIVAPNEPGNLLTFDEYSMETAVPPSTTSNAAASRVGLTGSGINGRYGVSLVPVDTDLVSWQLDRLLPVTVGQTYKVESYIFRAAPSTQTVEFSRRVRIDWYNDAGALVQADVPDAFYVSHDLFDTIGGSPISETRTCPPGATRARVAVEIMHVDTAITAYYLDRLVFTPSDAEYSVAVSNATGSISLTISYEPPFEDATRLSVYRMDEDGSEIPVRWYGTEFVNVPYTGPPVVVEDYEVPISTRVWYSVRWTDEAGNDVIRVQTQLTNGPIITDPNYIWFKSPGLPALSRLVMPESPIAWTRAARSVTYDVVGRKNPVTVSALRAGREGTLSLLIWDRATNEAFDALMDNGLPCLIQAAPGLGIDGNLYVRVGDITETPVSNHAPDQSRRWTLQLGVIDRPAGGMQGSGGRTWATVNELDTWQTVRETYAEWSGVLTGIEKE